MDASIKKDLSTLTTINEQYISKLLDIVGWCIADAAEKASKSRDNIVNIDMGFGIITLLITDDSIKYRFKPSSKFNNSISKAVVNERNDLVLTLESSLVDKLTNTYKDFL